MTLTIYKVIPATLCQSPEEFIEVVVRCIFLVVSGRFLGVSGNDVV